MNNSKGKEWRDTEWSLISDHWPVWKWLRGQQGYYTFLYLIYSWRLLSWWTVSLTFSQRWELFEITFKAKVKSFARHSLLITNSRYDVEWMHFSIQIVGSVECKSENKRNKQIDVSLIVHLSLFVWKEICGGWKISCSLNWI